MSIIQSNKENFTNEPKSPIVTESFRLSELATRQLLIAPNAFAEFQQQTNLADFFWQTTYTQTILSDAPFNHLARSVDGFVIFLHGWDGSHRIWEDLPARLTECLPNVVCLNADANGFNGTFFLNNTPTPPEKASLLNAMIAVEKWLEIIGLWPLPQRSRRPFYLFVGHSMGAGMMFYKNQPAWQEDRYGCYIMAPGMFYNNIRRNLLYRLVATLTRIPHITPLKNLAARIVVHIAMKDASRLAQYEHINTFYNSSFPTLIATLDGIGKSPKPPRTDWSQYQVTLGHADILVRVGATVNMLRELGFTSDQIKLLVGDHYFFSYDETSPINHKYNREVVLNDLVAWCGRLK
ncbi:hypothetical protein QUF58_01105 [Anaerolineales bacterium HSG24]|nr:hypothetical protein [Anaerolineales bacterium HSG24]